MDSHHLQAPSAPAAGIIELGTRHLPVSDRAEFWFEGTGRRMQCRPVKDALLQPNARVRVLVRDGIEFMDYTSESFLMARDRAMCERDGHDEISIGLVISPRTGAVQDGLELSLECGELYVIDFGRPVRSVLPDHRELAIALPRHMVAQIAGASTARLGGRKLSTDGIGGMLAAHMRALACHAAAMSAAQQSMAMQVAADLALATLQDACTTDTACDPDDFADGLYLAACETIDRCCVDPRFGVAGLAAIMGCSRARLYRLFQHHEQGIAAAIWKSRLQRARRMLCSRRYLTLSITEIALRSGFLDPSTFSRMFRHRYGMSPRDTREAWTH